MLGIVGRDEVDREAERHEEEWSERKGTERREW